MIDVNPNHLDTVTRILAEHVPECEVRAFGSRVTWTAKDYSDLDLAVVGARVLDSDALRRLKEAFEESDLPFRVDVLDWHAISAAFRKVIAQKYEVVQKGKQKSLGMAGEWRMCTVDQIKADEDRAIAIGPFGSRMKADRYVADGVPVIRGNNISDTRALVGDLVFVSDETADELRSCNVFPGDLVFPHRGAIGEVGFVPSDEMGRYMLSTSLMKLTCNRGLVDPLFIFYFFRSQQGRHALLQNASTVGTPGIGQPLASLRSISVPVPPLPEQRAIAHVLGTLDDKIELNRRMNETLEAIARALFKSWFVDFDPVRTKAEGRDPGLPKPLADLFPDSFEDSEFGEIPKGWRCSHLGEVAAKIGSGATPRGGGSVYVADGVALIRSQNVYDSLFVWDGLARISAAAADALAGVTVEREDVLLNITGASILRTCVVDPDVLPARVNQHVCIIRPKAGIPARYIHFHLLQPSTKGFLMGMDAGASRQAVTKGHIESVPLLIPSKAVLDMFASLAGPLFMAASNKKSESRSVASIRDALLPRLISGELRVSDADRIVSRATA